MLGAYSTFANYGNYNKPEMIWRIEDANGRVIKEVNVEPKEVMNPMYAYTMIELMKGVAQYGTASGELGRRGISKAVEIAGKQVLHRTTQTVGLWESHQNWQPEPG
jgi:penicillin-binding protein 1A